MVGAPQKPVLRQDSKYEGHILILDPSRATQQMLGYEFELLGFTCFTSGHRSALANVQRTPVALIVAELRFDDGDVFKDVLADASIARAGPPVVIHTSYGSIATAVRAIRMGAANYLVKPAAASQILLSVTHDNARLYHSLELRMTLSQAKWEFIHQAVEEIGTISGAARTLGLEPRSLRRMLQKTRPDSSM